MLSTTAMLEIIIYTCKILQLVDRQLHIQARIVDKLINIFLHRNTRQQTKRGSITAGRSLETWLRRKSNSGVPTGWCGWGRQDTYETLVIQMGPS